LVRLVGEFDGNSGAGPRGRFERDNLSDPEARRGLGEEAMSVMEWIGVALSIAVAIYLFVALLYPEKFE
jgi:K+-transporting ATPase KdpF subunit